MKTGNKTAFFSAIKHFFRGFWRILSHNFGLKLLSVLLSLFLWSYVITSNPSITREKTLPAVDITVTGQSVLSSRSLSLLTDVTALTDARVRVKAPQSAYSLVSADNVRVELDLSGVRSTGKQSVRLRGTSTYGSIIEIYPQYVDLEIENQDQRYVPVNVVVSGETDPAYWYSVSRANPSQITVTGPTSLVQKVSCAQVSADVTGRTDSHNRVEKFVLLDAKGQEISAQLSKSTNSIAVALDIYPTKTLPIVLDEQEAITGEAPDGYQIDGVALSPATVLVAADETLLEGLSNLSIVPVDVTDHTRTFTEITRINALKGVKRLSSEEVSVTVEISEQSLTKRFSNVPLQMLNPPDGKDYTSKVKKTDVKVTGPYSVIRALIRGDFQAVVNLNGLQAGEYELPIEVTVDNHPELSCACTPATVTVLVADRNAPNGF